MDTKDLIAHSRSRFDHAAAKRTLKEKYQGKLVFAHNGGMFKATPELINFLKSYNQAADMVITDLYDNPVRVQVPQLLFQTQTLYETQMNAWLAEYEQLNKNR
jgi:hypothetical protein